eukprot:s3661_g2.t2
MFCREGRRGSRCRLKWLRTVGLVAAVAPVTWQAAKLFVLLEKQEVQAAADCRQATLAFSDRRLQSLSSSMLKGLTSLPCGVVDEGVCEDAKVELVWPEEASEDLGRRKRKRKPVKLILTLGSLRRTTLAAPRKHLLLATPRPQQLERILPQVAQMGVATLLLCGASKVDPKYFRSHVLQMPFLKRCLAKGLAAARDTTMPKVVVHPNLQELLSQLDHFLPRDKAFRLVGHPSGAKPLELSTGDTLTQGRREALVAVGPEAGWSEDERSELDMLSSAGFQSMSLGQRILRSDVATTTLLALAEQMLA